MGLYLTQKVLRGDLWYWVPVDGIAGFGVALLMRVGIKLVTDYTGVIQFRHSGELGGAYWTMNMLSALASSFVAVSSYHNSAKEEVVLKEDVS